jgi:thiamine biosynthesis protein ThiS
MMVKVDGKNLAWHDGMTVADLLRELDDSYPYALARIDGRAVTGREFDKTTVPDNAEVFLVHLVAGG